MKPLRLVRVADRVGELSALDGIAEPLQKAVRAAAPQSSTLKDGLSGTWLGHPAHPPLTDVVIGTWTGALLLDLLEGERAEKAAQNLLAAGILAAVPTAATGLSDWAELRGADRRVGSVHALGNVTGLVLNILSWSARRRGRRSLGVALSTLGYGAAGVSAWLGGHLAFSKGIGVNRTAFDATPSEWTPVCRETELEERRLTEAQAGHVAVMLVRSRGAIYALADSCSHRGCALHEGELSGETVICPCHGSTFRLDGTIVTGPATSPQRRYRTRIHDGMVEVKG